MKQTRHMLVIALVALLAMGAAVAQEESTPDPQQMNAAQRDAVRQARREQWQNMSEEERAAAREQQRARKEEHRAAMRERYANMSEEERAAAREQHKAKMEQRRAARRERYESMSEEERQALRERHHAGKGMNHGKHGPGDKGEPKAESGD